MFFLLDVLSPACSYIATVPKIIGNNFSKSSICIKKVNLFFLKIKSLRVHQIAHIKAANPLTFRCVNFLQSFRLDLLIGGLIIIDLLPDALLLLVMEFDSYSIEISNLARHLLGFMATDLGVS